ncbi:CDT1-like protein a, chloroplastic [Dendrobium catenatum]|uniref:CDT1-like protein a, chloroplastic n=1 Tax=Dendrobium catenatum TaxID=906689 RepID=A0A2I0XDB9_9ASPA|nr:CDT1-like protein a, chloroplastic [Dendrobium catenatum]PKU85918.1 CDT1-like protein a, chloroplastic [Dendrobium catenatum]
MAAPEMESVKSSGFSGDMEKKEMPLNFPLRRKVSSAKVSASDEIPTPEKSAQLPRRASKRRLLFSVSDVRSVAKGLRMTGNKSANPSDLPRSHGELQRKSQSSSDSAARKTGKLSENYEMLAEFFNCLDSSVQLLRLKGALATFTNISACIQHLTERRFTYRHLAQMKHILPEAISIKKVFLHDETTCCMKPELQISLQVDSVESNPELKGESPYSAVRKVFRDRLVQFAREHPEEDDIPEETLPHPFGRTGPSMSTESSKLAPSIQTGSFAVAHPTENLTKVSHFSASFQRRFSTRSTCFDEIKTPLASFNDVVTNVDFLASSFSSPVKFSSKPPIQKKPLFFSPAKRPLVTHDQQIEEDSKMLISSHNNISSEVESLESTPVKDIPSSARLMITMPDLQTPKRSRIPSIDDTPQKVLVKRATRTKLFPTPRKNVKSDDEDNLSKSSSVADDVLGFLPESLLQDIRDKEKKAMEERDANVAGATLRKKLIASLPKLFNAMLLIFQYGNRSVITKQELVHTILSCNCSVTDRNEVEEQLELMEELVPDWIFRKAAATGDILYRVNKMSSSQEIRQRIAVAE